MVAQTPWIQRTFYFDFPIGNFPIIFNRLEGTIFRLGHMLMNVDDALSTKSAQGWSVKQHVGHLYDLEELWWKRLEDFQNGLQELTAADMSNEKTNSAGHNEKSLADVLELFVKERQKLLEVVYGFDESVLSLTSLHPRLQQPMRLIDSLFFVAEHDDHHLAKVATLLRRS